MGAATYVGRGFKGRARVSGERPILLLLFSLLFLVWYARTGSSVVMMGRCIGRSVHSCQCFECSNTVDTYQG